MQWQREGTMGMISEPFRVGKFAMGDHLAYRLWCGTELLGEFASFEECQAAAEEAATELMRGSNAEVTGGPLAARPVD